MTNKMALGIIITYGSQIAKLIHHSCVYFFPLTEQEGHAANKSTATIVPKGLLLACGVTWNKCRKCANRTKMCWWYVCVCNVLVSNIALVATLCCREPSPGLSTETVRGAYIRTLDRNNTNDNKTMHSIADMLLGASQTQSVWVVFDSRA